MSNVNKIINLNEINDFFINLEMQSVVYSYEIKENIKLFKSLCLSYDKELNHLLLLSIPIKLIEFFNSNEKQLLYFINVFNKINNPIIKKYILNQVFQYRKNNLANITKYLY